MTKTGKNRIVLFIIIFVVAIINYEVGYYFGHRNAVIEINTQIDAIFMQIKEMEAAKI